MRAGSMRERIRIERAQRGPRTGSGQPTLTWALQDTLSAELVENRGQELFTSNQVAAKADVVFKIRYPGNMAPPPSPSEDTRVIFEGKAYDIVSAPRVGLHRAEQHLFCTARAEAAA